MPEQKTLYVALDTETTGLDRFRDEIVQITIIPLFFDKDSESEFFKIDENKHIFNQFIIPMKPIDAGAAKVHGFTIEKLKEKGAVSPKKSVEIFKNWFATLGVKTLLPLGHNWADFDKMFVMHWLEAGGEKFSNYFGYQNRDTLVLSHFLNDVHSLLGLRTFNPKLHNISKDPHFLDESIRNRLELHQKGAHNAFDDSVIVIEVYNNFLLMMKNYYKFIEMMPETGKAIEDLMSQNEELVRQNEELQSQLSDLNVVLNEAKAYIQQHVGQ